MATSFSDLADLDFSDVAGWPTVAKVIAIIAVCAAVLGAGYWFDTQHQLAELGRAKAKEPELKQAFEVKQNKAANLDAYRAQKVEMEQSFGAMLRQLPSKTEVAELLVDISQAGIANGLDFELFKPADEVPIEFYEELPIKIRVTGSYHEFGQFVSDVAALPRIVTLDNFSIKGSGDNLAMEVTAKTYRYIDDQGEE
ncbi:type 4a pilus biogenesis protein PilO [Gammaproteobacteria bacterium AH-315-C21]|nr:type 4a pilus biogenesis protein PilO [Gammaproteobacteria bacterium AH-315-C21]